ncbi:CvpA family protein [Saccharophagus degradans]|uniref:CvpA family protein n=1 Tax=Saccharophagus degradans TaxID=86304 RepID=UPI001C0A0ED1|nr:CvpA family protein [Saccharophagus degradans]MBU2986389.1 CvpA family protein [Saccharophagus degradans]
MTIVWILFAGWVLYFALRGYLQGIWVTLLGLFGFAVAYGASLLCAKDAGVAIQGYGLGSTAAMMVASVVIFILAYLLASTLPKLFLEKWLDKKTFIARLAGAGAGTVLGCFSGLVIVWGATFLSAAWQSRAGNTVPAQLAVPQPLATAAGKLIGGVAQAGSKAVGAKEIHSQLMGALLANPEQFVEGFSSLSDSGVMEQFFNDGTAQYYMARKDYASLQQTPAFKNIAQQEGVQSISKLALAGKDGDPTKVQQSEINETLAHNMTFVWRRMEYLKTNPEVQQILNDPEVIKLVQDKNPLNIMFNAKVSRLVDLIMQEDSAMESHDFTQLKPGNPLGGLGEVKPEASRTVKPVKIYKWVDDNGNMQYTDYDNTPEHKRANAELMTAQGE